MNFIFLHRLILLVGLIVLLTMIKCGPGKRQEIKAESGIEYMDYCKSCLFFTPEVGLMGGEKEGNACYWKTTDGGRHWQQQKLTRGSVDDLTERDGVVYATVEKREKDTLLYTHSIYTSFDQGESWQLKCEMVTEESFIDLLVLDDNRMFMVMSNSILETQNGGKEWQMVRDEGCPQVSVDDKYLYYVISRNRILPKYIPIHYLVRRSLKSGRERFYKLPDGVKVEATCGDVIILEKEQHLRSYRIEEDMSLTFLGKLKQRAYSVDYMNRCGNQLFVDLPIGIAVNKLFYSPDGGVHWKYVDKGTWFGPTCMLADSTHVRMFIIDPHLYLKSYTHERIWAEK